MDEPELNAAAVAEVAGLLERETGSAPPLEDLSVMLGKCLAAYHRDRETSRDGIPTTAQMAERTAAIRDHLAAVTELLLDLHVNLWLDTFMAERGRTETGTFLKLGEHYLVARDAAEYFEDLARRGESPVVEYEDGAAIEHKRQTRTASRDRMLIPMLLALFRAYGLQLRDDGRFDVEALDTACAAIKAVLTGHGIAVPDAGKTTGERAIGRGERYQGRLRRLVKAAWDELPPVVDKNAPI